MIKYLAIIKKGHHGVVRAVDSRDVRRAWAEEEANGSKMIGEYSDKDVARRHMLLALERYSPLRNRRRA